MQPNHSDSGPTRRDVLSGLPLGLAGLVGGGAMLGLAQPAGADEPPRGGRPRMPAKLMRVLTSMHDGSGYTLPPLPYAYDAVDAAIDEETMRLHHTKHHQSYVNGLNTTVAELSEGSATGDRTLLYGLDRNLSFNYGGHVLHSIFWATMGPDDNGNMGGTPTGDLAAAIDESFGSLDGFKTLWAGAAAAVKGSGWVQLVFDPVAVRLAVVGVNDQDQGFMPGTFPLLPLDVWEHAYYLRYQNRRSAYVENFMKVIDWTSVAALYAMVSAPYRRG
ncbi:MAG: superoxide dismutase [Planctomycetota bacterium]